MIRALFWFTSWGVYNVFIALVVKQNIVAIQNKNLGELYKVLIVLIGGIIFYHVCNYLVLRWGYVEHKVKHELNTKVFPFFFAIENDHYEKIGTGRLLATIQRGIDTRSSGINDYMLHLPQALVSLVMAIIVIGQIGSRILLGFFLVLVVMSFFISFLQKKGFARRVKRNEAEHLYIKHFIRMIMSKFEIVQSNKTTLEIESLNSGLNKVLEIDKKKHLFEHITYNIGDLSVNLIRWFLLLYMGTRAISGSFGYGDIVLMLTVVGYLEKSLMDITNIYKRTIKHTPTIQKLRDFIDTTPTTSNIHLGKKFVYKKGEFEDKNLSFSYNKKTPVFQNFSLSLAGGTKTALVGESGSGKTTLIKLLAGYLNPNEGEILIDNQSLSKISLSGYYNHIGYLTQEPSIFDGTVYENLVYALSKKPGESALHEVIKKSKCDFIRELPDGLQSEIGERGVRLSGGQKQRLAIAKIMLKNPEIIMLDEPTSALDSFNEEQINIALHNLFLGKTVFIIAHRLQTVQQADRILFFENGLIIEDGTHQSLSSLNGHYKKMLDIQTGF
ncbi:MAG TPA: ABC transporter ATP-binding protein [Candidatus Absconditabacterales bacterium]|nr:ABC transporter ATP-binding protein [Candidatus Absconditabacterales bacterium]